ncbi:MAG: UpxY family transcription antiterminator [Bacteroidales bacterium]|jgi:transcription antitermination factor NusG|nr:UpxY family transcription antiterminator [Bacteroidales bacterium]
MDKEDKRQWFVLRVRSRAEKKVLRSLTDDGIEAYLPIQKVLRQWSDRKKLIDVPVVTCYVFVRVTNRGADYIAALKRDNVLRFMCEEGKPIPIRDSQIAALKLMLNQDEIVVDITREMLRKGQTVEIIEGPCVGLCGELVSVNRKNKVAICIDAISHTFMIDAPIDKLAIIKKRRPAK